MGKKITLSQLAQLMSANSGMTEKVCESFLKAIFKTIGNGLEEDGIVKIKELGTFKLLTVSARKSVDVNSGADNEIPAHRKVVFVPSKELAASVNSPFEMFETVEVADEAIEGVMTQPAEDAAADEQDTVEAEAYSVTAIQDAPVVQDAPVEQDAPEVKETPEEDREEEGGSEDDSEENDIVTKPESEVEIVSSHGSHRRGFGHGFIWGIVVALLVCLGACGVLYYMYKDNFIPVSTQAQNGKDENQTDMADAVLDNVDESEALLNTDNGEATVVDNTDLPEAAVPTEPSDTKPEYDTITDTRYLTTMAKDHYGNYHLWPYIYKENEKILGHPNRIRPGTRIVIPDLRKYGVDPKNKEDIEKAKKLGAEIYSRYQ